MKRLSSILLTLTLSSAAFADSVSCTLRSGQKRTTVTIRLDDADLLENGKSSNAAYDLSFDMNGACERKSCEMYLTIYSGIVEDEVGSTGFGFKRTGNGGEVFREALTNAPDGKDYTLSCTYKS